jgi:stage III sporulation protein SpoIIIAA
MPSILTDMGKTLENISPLTVRISKCRRGIFEFLFRIDGINGWMRPKNKKW